MVVFKWTSATPPPRTCSWSRWWRCRGGCSTPTSWRYSLAWTTWLAVWAGVTLPPPCMGLGNMTSFCLKAFMGYSLASLRSSSNKIVEISKIRIYVWPDETLLSDYWLTVVFAPLHLHWRTDWVCRWRRTTTGHWGLNPWLHGRTDWRCRTAGPRLDDWTTLD